MTKILIILVVAFTFEAFGVIALKKGLNEIGAQYTARQGTLPVWKNVVRLVGNWFTNKSVLFGLLLETIFFVLLQYLIGQRDVSFVWPLTAISSCVVHSASAMRRMPPFFRPCSRQRAGSPACVHHLAKSLPSPNFDRGLPCTVTITVR